VRRLKRQMTKRRVVPQTLGQSYTARICWRRSRETRPVGLCLNVGKRLKGLVMKNVRMSSSWTA
jgi:hypothetical protein